MRINLHDWTKTVLMIAALLLLAMSIAGCPAAEGDSASQSNQASQTAGSSAASATDVVKQTADKLPAVELTHAVLAVSGMTCGSCEEAIKREVGKLNGVANVTAAYADGHVEVDFDATLVSKDAIVTAIENMQYVVEQFQVGEADTMPAEDEPADESDKPVEDTPKDKDEAEAAAKSVESGDADPASAAVADKEAAMAVEDCEECDGECDGDCDGGGEGCGGSDETAEASDDGGEGCAGCAKEAAGVSVPTEVPEGMQRITLNVENMNCAGKSGWVNKTVGGLEGVAGCYADEGTLTAVIDFDAAMWDAAKLIEVINAESEGFFAATEI